VATLSISKAWDETRATLRRDGKLLATVALALLVLPQAVLGPFLPSAPGQLSVAFKVLLVVAIVASIAAQVALNRLAIPPSATVGAGIHRGLARTPAVLLALFLVFLVVTALFVLFAGILVATGVAEAPVAGRPPPGSLASILVILFVAIFSIFQLIVPVGAVEHGGPFRLIGRAWTLARPHYWRLVGFLLLILVGMLFVWLSAQVIAGLVFTAIFGPPRSGSVGLTLTSIVVALVQAGWTTVTSVMIARIYLQLAGAGAEATVPSSGT
jgi:hypothetical protein